MQLFTDYRPKIRFIQLYTLDSQALCCLKSLSCFVYMRLTLLVALSSSNIQNSLVTKVFISFCLFILLRGSCIDNLRDSKEISMKLGKAWLCNYSYNSKVHGCTCQDKQ